jgi:hypothetical protein
VNWSALEVALAPIALLTVTSTVPTAWAGLTAVMLVSEFTTTPVAAVAPK